MAKFSGNTHRLWIESATAGTYNAIAGQVSHRVNRQANQIDTSTKDSGSYGTSMPGQRALTISASFIKDLPDANGQERLFSRAAADPQVATNFQIRKAPYSGTDIVFAASMFIQDLNDAAEINAAAAFDCTLVLAAAPTTDTLG
jgi:predicted secreted protein